MLMIIQNSPGLQRWAAKRKQSRPSAGRKKQECRGTPIYFASFPGGSGLHILFNRSICFANFLLFVFWSHIPRTMYFTGFPVIFNLPISMPFRLHSPNFIFGENSFCFLKFPICDFFKFGGYWGNKILPSNS